MATRTPTQISIGAHVRRLRSDQGISRETLAYESSTSVATLARLELHDKAPNLATLGRIASTLGVSVGQLVDVALNQAAS